MTDKVKEILETNPTIVLNQVQTIIKNSVPFQLFPSPSGPGFFGVETDISKGKGILSVKASTTEDGQIIVALGIFKAFTEPLAPFKEILLRLSNLGERLWLQQSEKDFFEVVFKVEPTPMGITRMEKLQQKIREISELAIFLQQTVVAPNEDHKKLAEKYEHVKSILSPVIPLNAGLDPGSHFKTKCHEVINLLNAGISVAISSEQQLPVDFFLELISACMAKNGKTLGIYTESMLLSRGISEVIKKAPGIVTIPSIVLSFGTNVYDRATELDALMAILTKNGTPVLFTGNYAEHQSVFGSGQGHQAYPLQPAIIHLKNDDPPLDSLIAFAINREIATRPAISKADELQIQTKIKNLQHSGTLKLDNLDLITSILKSSFSDSKKEPAEILEILKTKKETFRGLRIRNKNKRDENIQQMFFESMQTGNFPQFLSQNLIGQDKALNKATDRLWIEFLTRPPHQPVRMILQGIPGVGKSEFSQYIAEFFNIPHVSIDTASLQSHHEASSLLLGSGRGIVQSYMPGKLETMAKHHEGCVAEVADLDHCETSVRGFIADLFLHILENGYAQTATGETISCTNLIIIFTINLPGGKDESVLKGLGFNSGISEQEILGRTMKEIKSMFSGAFVSRVGNPILFKPFSQDEKAAIMEMALNKSLKTSMQNIKLGRMEMNIAPGTGKALIPQIEALDQGLGARGIYDLARELITGLVMKNFDKIKNLTEGSITIKINKSNQLIMNL